MVEITSDRANFQGQLALNKHGVRRLSHILLSQRIQTLAQITTQLNQGTRCTVSKWTVHLSLRRMGFGRRRSTRVPLLNSLHRAARLAWAREHREWTLEDWKRVAWSYESRFRLLHAYGRLKIWCQAHEVMDPECQVGTVHGHVGSIMVWGVFFWLFLGSLVLIPTSLNAIRSRLATSWLDEHYSNFSVINWAPGRPDLNPIEHLWDVLEKGVKAHHTTPATLTELWTALADVWQAILVERFSKLVESMPRRLAALSRPEETQLVINLLSLIQWNFSVFSLLLKIYLKI
ncbi:Transposable element Tc1 transposase [Araneus ventricosus]|uniref:Transposable element Tc1 transposase n=1 Tax=Araneus ventricosus TaxID=182803 RepID=A0A4Y2CBA8_ARAVE|nr:Transposable element Tc1 transposase [Araneus ventricosus]